MFLRAMFEPMSWILYLLAHIPCKDSNDLYRNVVTKLRCSSPHDLNPDAPRCGMDMEPSSVVFLAEHKSLAPFYCSATMQ